MGLHPNVAHFKFTSFSTRIFFIFYYIQIKPREGHEVGNGTQDPKLQGDCPPTDTQWIQPFIHTVPRTAVPYPWTQGKHLPGSTRVAQGHGTVAGLATNSVRPCGLPPWHPGVSSPLPPTLLSPQSCLSGIIWGFFFSGGQIFCMTL